MFQRLKKLFFTPALALLVMVTMSVGLAASAQAAQPTYQPTFSPNQHVYLDPLLENGNPSVNLNGLEQKLIDEGKKHNVDFYFVMAQKGSEPAVQGVPFAKSRMDDMLGKWLGSKNFNSSRYVILYLIRLDTDWTKSSYAINPAPALASEGITGATMLTVMDQWGKTNSPTTLLPRSPRDFAAKIASEANRLVDDQIAANQRQEQMRKDQAERQRLDAIRQQELARQAEKQRIADAQAAEARNAQIKPVVIIGGPIALLIIIFGFLFFRFNSAKTRANAALADWRKKIEPASANLLQLDSEYLSFLMSLSANFVGETQVALTSAKTDYGTLSARIKKAIALSNEAERLIAKAGIFSVDKLTQAADMLTSTKITVTGEDIPLEQRSLFSGVVSESSFTPSELLQDMDQLFTSASGSCASIMKSYKGAEQNKQDINQLLATVTKLQGELSERGLPFTPYETSHAAVTTGQREFMTLMASDPLKAYTKSEAVESAVEALKALITRAIELRDSVQSTDKTIAAAQAKVDGARAQPANYKWVEPVMSATALPEKNLFNEEGGNPDVPLKPLATAWLLAWTCSARVRWMRLKR
ncbi:MAG: hypothetical protein IPL73_01190 [Candidatus Obscuribacter sp.]|nr:hypothetical protein [Candidatus Obscuribacter sp.]